MKSPKMAKQLTIVLLGLVLLALHGACSSADPSSTGGEAVATSPSTAAPDGGPGGAVNFHGHWVVTVEEPTGEIASRTEFDNAFVGASTLVSLLNGSFTAGSWTIILSGSTDVCTGSAEKSCLITEADVQGNTKFTYDSFDLTVTETAGAIVLSGSTLADASGSITSVGSALAACVSTVAPASCTAGNAAPTANVTATAISPIAVVPGQAVRVEFSLTLADAVAPVASTGLVVPEAVNDLAFIEIDGVFFGHVVVVSGPGFELERILGFFDDGSITESPGLNAELPFIFEYKKDESLAGLESGDSESLEAMLTEDSNKTAAEICTSRAMSMLVMSSLPNNGEGFETARFNLFGYGMTKIEPGADGRLRYTMEHQCEPNNVLAIDLDGSVGSSEGSMNPETGDRRVEIGGVNTRFPQVVVDEENRTLTLTYDGDEAGGIFEWAKVNAGHRTENRELSVIEPDPGSDDPFSEISRMNYFEVFPIRFQVVDGFGSSLKQKHQVVLTYARREQG